MKASVFDQGWWTPAFAHLCSVKAVWIPAPGLREDRLRGNDSPHGVFPKVLFRRSREGGNP